MDLSGMQGFRHAHRSHPEMQHNAAGAIRARANDSAEAPAAATAQSHNRDKRASSNCSPFHELGVDAQGHLIPAWRAMEANQQVHRSAGGSSLERLPLAQQEHIHVVDFGSGKGYLTFAVHDWLQHTLHREVRVWVWVAPRTCQLSGGVIRR